MAELEFTDDLGLLGDPTAKPLPPLSRPESPPKQITEFTDDIGLFGKARVSSDIATDVEAYRKATPTQRQQMLEVDKDVEEKKRKLFNQPQFTGKTYEGRPVVRNPDGSWSHEKSITIEADGRHMNIPTLFGGKEYSPDKAVEIMRKNKWIDPDTGKPVPTFKTQEEAVAAAQAKERAQQQQDPATFQKRAVEEPQKPGFMGKAVLMTDAEKAKIGGVLNKLREGIVPQGAQQEYQAMQTDPQQYLQTQARQPPTPEQQESMIVHLTGAAPIQAPAGMLNAVKSLVPGIGGKWPDFVDRLATSIANKIPQGLKESPTIKYFRAGRGTPLEFREARAQMEADVANAVDQAVSIGTKLKQDLTPGQKLRADQLLRGSISPVEESLGTQARANLQARGVNPAAPAFQKDIDAEIGNILNQKVKSGQATPQEQTYAAVLPARKAINEIQQELVDLGRVSPETVERFQENFGPYIARLYAAKEFGKDPVFIPFGQPVRAGTERLKMRGERVDVEIPMMPHITANAPIRTLPKAEPVNIGGKTFRIAPVTDIESGVERANALKPLLDAGFKVETRAGNKVTLFRDLPEDIRATEAGKPVVRGGEVVPPSVAQATPGKFVKNAKGEWVKGGEVVGTGLGEIRAQPGYVAGKTIAQTGTEVARVKFFNTVADNPEWTSVDGWGRPSPAEGYVKMPDDKKTLANLAGKYVRSDIAAEINDAVKIRGDAAKIIDGITQLWKISKVTNPATIGRNIMSSAGMANWGGMSPWKPSGARSYSAAISGLLGKDKIAEGYLAEAKKLGVNGAGYNHAELKMLAEGFEQSKEVNPLLRMVNGFKYYVEKTGAPQLYGNVDEFFKSALYIHGRQEMGLSPQLAARYAKKYGIDYQDVSPFVRDIRRIPLGSPFISFASKALPLSIETAVKHPVRFWKYPAMLWGYTELSKDKFLGEREEIERAQDMGKLHGPRYALLPTKSEEGRYRFLDLGYILPFGDLLELHDRLTGGGGGGNIAFAPLGGPFQPLAEVAFNKSLFTQQPIYNETDTAKEVYAKISDHVLKGLLPSLAPPIPGTGFRGGWSTEAFRQALAPQFQLPLEAPLPESDFLGRQRGIMATFASKMLGINIKEVSIKDLQRIGLMDFQAKLNELNKSLARTALKTITPEQKQVEIDKLEQKYRALAEETKTKMLPQISKAGATEPTKAPPVPSRTPRAPVNLPEGFKDDMGLFK